MKPRAFFVTSGYGQSDFSSLVAFDLALKEAGVEGCNLVPVSSIIPADCARVEREDIEAGSITFVVLSRKEGNKGERVSAGLAICSTDSYTLVAEFSGNMEEEELKKRLLRKAREMAKVRGFEVRGIELVTRSEIVQETQGCVVSLVVFLL